MTQTLLTVFISCLCHHLLLFILSLASKPFFSHFITPEDGGNLPNKRQHQMGNMSCIVLLSPTSSLSALVGLLQVQQSLEKIARLEQEKEHWLLEAQLGKVRLEKENQRISDLEAQLAAALGGSPAAQSAAAGTLTQSHEETESESAAAGKELTLCTSLVSVPARVPPRRGSTFECRLVFVFMCFFAKL